MGLLDDILRLPDGLDYRLNATGQPLTETQLRHLMLARAIAGKPRLLLVDEVLDTLAEDELDRICQTLTGETRTWTLIVVTVHSEVAKRFDRVIEIEPGGVEKSAQGSRPQVPKPDVTKPKPPSKDSP